MFFWFCVLGNGVFFVLAHPKQYIIRLFSGLCVWWCLVCCPAQNNTSYDCFFGSVCLVVFGVLVHPKQYIIWLFSGLCF